MIILILIFSLIIRLISIDQSLWLDEAISVVYATNSSFKYFVTEYPIGDFHPPGYFAILWIWIKTFGDSEISVRFPSLVFGVLTILLTFLVGKELFSKKVALVASIFLSLAPLHVYYSQEARMYAFAAFAAILSTYLLIKLVQFKKYFFVLYGLSLSLVLYSDYLAYLILPAHFIYIFFYRKKAIKTVLLSYLIAFLLFIPWLLILPTQLKSGLQTATNVEGWSNIVGGVTLKQILLLPIKIIFGRVGIDNFSLYIFFGLIFSVPFVFGLYNAIGRKNEKTFLLFMSVFLPIIGAILISFFVPVFSYFRFVFILPLLYLLLALGLFQLKETLKKVLIGFMILTEVYLSFTYLLNPLFHREDWKEAVDFVTKREFKNTTVVFENNETLAPFIYYFMKKGSNQTLLAGLKSVPALNVDNVYDFSNLARQGKEILLFEYLIDVTDPKKLLMKQLEANGYRKINTYDFRGVGFIYQYKYMEGFQ
ncbi:glycosyltransferase family 39 protein [Candidatus Daviesbacteria bacterium]|nr:glycosyltransferase family 39 protein [Candidatus Daviesbacteria bacterium]